MGCLYFNKLIFVASLHPPTASHMQPSSTPEAQQGKPTLYSDVALLAFSTLINPVVGGVLAYSSLKAAGQPRAASYALQLSAVFAIFTYLVSRNIMYGVFFAAGLGYVWGGWLGRYIRRKVPDIDSYPRKNALRALLVWLLIITLVVVGSLWLQHYQSFSGLTPLPAY